MMKIKTINIIVLFFVSISISCFLNNKSIASSYQYSKDLECSLTYLDMDIDILEMWNNKYQYDNELGDKIKQMIISKILLLRSINPDLDKIKWNQLESIDRLINFIKFNGLSIKKNRYICDLASEYLLSIDNEVKEILKSRNEEQIKFNNEVKNRVEVNSGRSPGDIP